MNYYPDGCNYYKYECEQARAEFESRWIDEEMNRLIEEEGYDEDDAMEIAEENFRKYEEEML